MIDSNYSSIVVSAPLPTAAIIIPTTGAETVIAAINSALAQTFQKTTVYVVIDGHQYVEQTYALLAAANLKEHPNIRIYSLPENTGAGGQNGHRIYSAFAFLTNADWLFYLDQDCWFDNNHVESCISLTTKTDLDWCYSLRKIIASNGDVICNDDCESLGKYRPVFDYNLCDTGTYCIKRTAAISVAQFFVGQWGHDRRYYAALATQFPKFDTTGLYTLNYKLGGNNTLTGDMWLQGNKTAADLYGEHFPWNAELAATPRQDLKALCVIFNWKGQYENAVKLESQLKEFVDTIVINSDDSNTPSHWINIGDTCYFSRQFKEAVKQFDSSKYNCLWHIQADASFKGNWADIWAAAQKSFAEYNWGIYAPNVDDTFYIAERADVFNLKDNLTVVATTDSTCWMMHSDIIKAMQRNLTLMDNNELGWGWDLLLSAFAHMTQRKVIRDYNFVIDHPASTAYMKDKAEQEMQEMFNKCSKALQRTIYTLKVRPKELVTYYK